MPYKLTYDLIQKTAEDCARKYRLTHKIPDLPDKQQTEEYKKILYEKYLNVITKVKEHVAKNESWGGHGYEHLEYVAVTSGYFANSECVTRGIVGKLKEDIVEMATLAGLFHDVDRHLGFGDNHMIEGGVTTKLILGDCICEKTFSEIVVSVVKNHDNFDYHPKDEVISIVFGSVFDVDHFKWGLERETTFWRMKEKIGMPATEVIHDYKWLLPLRTVWRTKLGKKIGSKYIDFGVFIAEEIERRLGNN
jgi:hypothetical protein